MTTLAPVYTFAPYLHIQQLVVVGVGGTGSHLARKLARVWWFYECL